jgi:hypothetical protein
MTLPNRDCHNRPIKTAKQPRRAVTTATHILQKRTQFSRGTPGRLHITASTAPGEICAERGPPYNEAMHRMKVAI